MADTSNTYVYVSNDSEQGAGGLYIYRLNTDTASMDFQAAAAAPPSSKYIAIDPQQRYLYATSTSNIGQTNGLIHAFAIDHATGRLTLLDQADVKGSEPAHCSLDKTGKFALVANYMGAGSAGTITVYRLEDNGHIGAMTDHHEIMGSSVHPDRQQRSHPHQILVDPSNRFVLVPDLGTDRIMVYYFDINSGRLTPHEEPYITAPAGSGPRHVAFHPHLPCIYLINELSNTLIVYGMDTERGTFQELQIVSTLPEGFTGESYCAAVRIAPDGRTVYGTNRGHNSLAIFSIDQDSGKVSLIGHQSTLGNWPRDFNIEPSGKLLVASNQKSDDLFLYRVDSPTGKLQPIGSKVNMPAPICIEFVVV